MNVSLFSFTDRRFIKLDFTDQSKRKAGKEVSRHILLTSTISFFISAKIYLMERNLISKLIFSIIILLVFAFDAVAQKVTAEKLVGCWEIKSIEFLQPMEDSIDMINNTKGLITCFTKDGKFVTKRKEDKGFQIVGTGTFDIRPDGKTIDQKNAASNNSVDESAEVLIRTDQKISFKVKEFILNYELSTDK